MIIYIQGLKKIEIIVQNDFLDNSFLLNMEGSTAPILRLAEFRVLFPTVMRTHVSKKST